MTIPFRTMRDEWMQDPEYRKAHERETALYELYCISAAGGCAYLGQPYTKYEVGLDAAAYDGGVVAAKLLQRGIRVFCPIGHSHYLSRVGYLDATDGELWQWADKFFVDKCDALIVLKLDGWQSSKGLAHEIAEFTAARKPIVYLSPEDVK